MDFYYINATGRSGPVNADQLRALSLQGVITQDTIIEAGGKTFQACKVKGLEFAAPSPKPESDFAVSLDRSKHAFKPIAVQAAKAENRRRVRINAAELLNFWCRVLIFAAWINFLACVVVGVILFVNARTELPPSFGFEHSYEYAYDETMIAAGIASIVSGIIAIIILSFLAALGRYITTRDNDK
ncbi:MAG: hypothetical protein ACOX6D_01695 [Thermoguttaceae bacterium]|jgi:hypothetical protein